MIIPGIVPHCDEPGCDLGSLQYECPKCKQHITDYHNFGDHNYVKVMNVTCPHCKHEFQLQGFGNE